VRLLDNDRLVHQFVSLERKTTRIGRDIISHPDYRNSHDDLANAAAISLTLTAARRAPVFWDFRQDVVRYLAEHPEP
jgi:hypothetical protein